MSDTTPRSGLPLLAAAQAQKHVTHNEALLELDALLYARLITRTLSAPPATSADGDTYLIKTGATGAWVGQDGRIAYAFGGGWRFYAPFAGLVATVADESKQIVFGGAAWTDVASPSSPSSSLTQLGINTAADATNKLAVKTSAVLLDNIGNGLQLKLNKHAAADTASLLYQTNYSGRAEMGLTGDDAFRVKVSADGTSWITALSIDASGGVLVGTTASTETNCRLNVRSLNNTEWYYPTLRLDSVDGNGVFRVYNGTNRNWSMQGTVVQAAANSTTLRSISASGTINVSGADYAEYERKSSSCGVIAKGQIVGFDANGQLTDKWHDARSFGVKSTAPSYVGGDDWGSEDALGTTRDAPDHDAKLETARAKVDRIAYSGKVPMNVTSAAAGDIIIAAQDGDGIKGVAVTAPDFAQYRLAVGRVRAVLPDGRALVAVIVH
jgi:hypothetical protein